MPYIGVKQNSYTQFYIPDAFRMRWLLEGNRICRKAKPEDGCSPKNRIIPLRQAKAAAPAEVAPVAPAPAPAPVAAAPVEVAPTPAKPTPRRRGSAS